MLLVSFYKTRGFLMFTESIEGDQWSVTWNGLTKLAQKIHRILEQLYSITSLGECFCIGIDIFIEIRFCYFSYFQCFSFLLHSFLWERLNFRSGWIWLFLNSLSGSNVSICLLKFNDRNFTNSSIDIVSVFVCIATDLYIRSYLHSFNRSWTFGLVFIYNIVDVSPGC